MANYAIQLRRGTSGQHGSFTGLAGEITVNTSNNSIHVHDGSTAGGTEMATKASVDTLSTDTLKDADNDTTVKVEASSDSDEILFTSAGTQVAKITSSGFMPMVNSNGSTGFDLGATTAKWRDLYLSEGSLYINNKKVIEDDSGTITVSTAADQNMKIKTSGSGRLQLEAGAAIDFNTNCSVTAGTSWGTSDNNPMVFADGIKSGNVQISGNNVTNAVADENLVFATTGSGVINFSDNAVFAGDLTVNGTTTTVSSTNTTVTDPLILLNKDASGSNSKDLGHIFERGSDTNVGIIWDESADEFAMITTSEDGTTAGDVGVTAYADFHANNATLTASSAKYADLAERYHAGSPIEAGTVVCFGGDNEIEMCNEDGCTAVAGVVSTAPAFMMNREAGDDNTHPYVALAGRVPCKVMGPVRKGDLLMSAMNGYAKAGEFKGGAMIGKALENFDGETGTIEILVNLM